MKREDDFIIRRQHLEGLSEAELDARFWELLEKIVTPMVDMAGKYTSPSIERSILLRMGFSSLEAKSIADKVIELGLLGKGAGNVVYRLARKSKVGIHDAGTAIIDGGSDDEIKGLFKGGEKFES